MCSNAGKKSVLLRTKLLSKVNFVWAVDESVQHGKEYNRGAFVMESGIDGLPTVPNPDVWQSVGSDRSACIEVGCSGISRDSGVNLNGAEWSSFKVGQYIAPPEGYSSWFNRNDVRGSWSSVSLIWCSSGFIAQLSAQNDTFFNATFVNTSALPGSKENAANDWDKLPKWFVYFFSTSKH